jgi:hypothetical protein
MKNEVKKQHYVWEHYLKGWAENDQIWCKRREKIFQTSTENIAQERYFYELEPLTDAEIALLKAIVLRGPETTHRVNLSSLQTYLAVAASAPHNRRFGLEYFHSQVEGKAANTLRELRLGNAAILNDQQSKIDMCSYMGHQYTRTKKVMDSFLPLPEETIIPEHYKDVNFTKIQRAMGFIFANGIGNSLYGILNLRLIKNETETRLLTSDQPIYNLDAVKNKIAETSSIYMPISSSYALWAKKGDVEEITTDEQATKLNAFMVENSLEVVFSDSEAELRNL